MNPAVDPVERARSLVLDFYNRTRQPDDRITPDKVKLVWFSKTLQNWKALVCTISPDNTYYEITYDGDKDRVYFDVYDKVDNLVVSFPGGWALWE